MQIFKIAFSWLESKGKKERTEEKNPGNELTEEQRNHL